MEIVAQQIPERAIDQIRGTKMQALPASSS